MATVVTTCSYSKGRGRGVLALKENFLQKKPGVAQSNVSTTTATKLEAPGPEAPGPEAPGPEAAGPEAGEGDSAASKCTCCSVTAKWVTESATNFLESKKVLIVMHKYTANANSPGGFPELSVEKGDSGSLYKIFCYWCTLLTFSIQFNTK